MSSVYQINKGINKSLEFKGLKAQYIWWLAGGMMIVMVLFAIMFIIGLNAYICVGFAFVSGGAIFIGVYKLSNKYGEFGMMKMMAKRSVPKEIKSGTRKLFIKD